MNSKTGKTNNQPEKTTSPQTSNRIYLFRVSLPVDKSDPDWKEHQVWRDIALRGTNTMVDFHKVIFKAFDREDEHMWSFFFGKPYKPTAPTFVSDFEFREVVPENTEPGSKMKIENLPLPKNGKFTYLFDYGDEWWHEITFLRTAEAEPKTRYPKVVEKFGDSPPQYPDEDWDEDESEDDECDLDFDEDGELTEEQQNEVYGNIFKLLFDEKDVFRKEVSYDEAGREVVKMIPDPSQAFNNLMEANKEYFQEDTLSNLTLKELEEALKPFKKAVSVIEASACIRGVVVGAPVEAKRICSSLIKQRKNIAEDDLNRLIDVVMRFKERFSKEFLSGNFRSFHSERMSEDKAGYLRWMQSIADKIAGFYMGLEMSKCDPDLLDEDGNKALDKLEVVDMFINQLLEDSESLTEEWLLGFEPMLVILDALAHATVFEISRAFKLTRHA